MWRINKSKLLNLYNRNNINRLISAYKQINAVGSPPFLKYQIWKTEVEQKFERNIQNIFTSFEFGSKQLKMGMKSSANTNSEQLAYKHQLREFLLSMKQNLDIPLINSFRDYLNIIPTNIFEKLHHQFEYIAKVIKLQINKSTNMQRFIKEQCYWLLDHIQKKLHHYYYVNMNKTKLKQTCFRLMNINKILTESCNQSNLSNQLYWTLEYGIHSQKSQDIKQAQLCFTEVFQKSINHIEYRYLALKYLCRLYEKYRNMEELKKILKIVKQQKIEKHYKLIMESISRICDEKTFSMISKQEEELKNKQNNNVQRPPNTINKMDG